MPLVVAPVQLEDFEALQQYLPSNGGVLASPLVLRTWPVEDSDNASLVARNIWSFKQQREIFLDDPTAIFIKAVDTETGETIAIARWHKYPHGFPLENMAWELNGRAPDAEETWPEGLDVDSHKALVMKAMKDRPRWAGGGPQWCLTSLITRSGHYRRGAGGMLVAWGVERAKKEGVPAYVEASKMGKPMYERYGFRTVEEVTFDDIGLSGMVLSLMVAKP